MGTAKSIPDGTREQWKLEPREQEDRLLFAKVMMFDLDLGKKPKLTIARRFARENTNDLGQQLNVLSAQLILTELKKFLYVLVSLIKKEEEHVKY